MCANGCVSERILRIGVAQSREHYANQNPTRFSCNPVESILYPKRDTRVCARSSQYFHSNDKMVVEFSKKYSPLSLNYYYIHYKQALLLVS